MGDRSGRIGVLLVDDDVEWVTATGAALENADADLSVITATGGWEALDLLDRERFDCVVCDYRMPDFDGIALLERIRAEVGDVPFILVTGAGSEAVASRAISSRVTDYFIKEPDRDQAPALAARIRSAVESYRTRRALAAARRRFTELFESVPDPVAIGDADGGLVAANGAFRDLFDPPADVEGIALDAVIGTAEDLDATAFRAADGRLLAAETTRGEREFLLRTVRLERPDGDEYAHVFTDVTRQRDRERELERFYELAGEVRELLLSAGSRDELERRFCAVVRSSVDCSIAAFGERGDAGDVSVRAAAGDIDDRLERALFEDGGASGADGPDGHPVEAVLRTGTPRHVPDLEAASADWAATVRSAGIRELLVLPVHRAEIPTGVFVVGASDPSTLDDTATDRLEALVSSLGDALDLVSRASALAADRADRVTLTIGDDAALLNALTRETAVAVDVAAAITADADGMTLYVDVEADDLEDVVAWVAASDAATGRERAADGRRARVRVETTAATVATTLAGLPVAVDSIRSEAGRTTVTVDVPVSADVRDVVDAIEDAWGSVTVESIRSIDPDPDGTPEAFPFRDLTAKQRRAVETAFHEGYYEQPRDRSADEVAAVLDISRSTFLQHLRTAERKLLAALLEGGRRGRET